MAGKFPYHYSVYESGTDRPICIHGTAVECAAALGVAVETFRTYIAKKRKNHPQAPEWFQIYFDEEDDSDDFET